ncbi:MAG: hypothetical protein ACOYON_13475, partial [Fimbriimonas sp.]
TAIPEDLGLQYNFTTEVTKLKTDGIVALRYRRPTFTVIEGETEDTGIQTKVEKVNFDFELTVSPINDILEAKDLTPKPTPKKGKGKWLTSLNSSRSAQFEDFLGEIYRLALFVGSFDSALDFAPKLPLDDVKVGDTWKQTVGYQPQRLKGTKKQAVQRLDMNMTYKGIVPVGKTSVHRIQADVNLDTDLAEFINQSFEVTSEDTGLAKVSLKLKVKIDFDLDLKTRKTLLAVANADGGLRVFLTGDLEEPEVQEKIRGRTTMRLIPNAVTPKPKK